MSLAPMFIGFESSGEQASRSEHPDDGTDLSRAIGHLLRRLDENAVDPRSILLLELFVAAPAGEAVGFCRGLREELGGLLDQNVRPVVTIIPVATLGPDSRVGVQAIVVPGHHAESSPGGRFPESAVAGGMFASVSSPVASVRSAVVQQAEGMDSLRQEVRALGADIADVVHVNFFYVSGNDRDAWKEEALARAAIFSEPGPCATGIPISQTAQSGGVLQLSAYGVVGARAQGSILGAWAGTPWVWPFPLPYRHGNRIGHVVVVGGQSSTETDAALSPQENLVSHTEVAFRKVADVLTELNASVRDLARLTAYYVTNGHSEAETIRAVLSKVLDGQAVDISLVGVNALAHPGMVVEIDGQAIVTS